MLRWKFALTCSNESVRCLCFVIVAAIGTGLAPLVESSKPGPSDSIREGTFFLHWCFCKIEEACVIEGLFALTTTTVVSCTYLGNTFKACGALKIHLGLDITFQLIPEQLYYSLVYFHFEYAVTSWGSTSPYLLKQDSLHLVHIEKMIKKLYAQQLLYFDDIYKLQFAKMKHQCKHSYHQHLRNYLQSWAIYIHKILYKKRLENTYSIRKRLNLDKNLLIM